MGTNPTDTTRRAAYHRATHSRQAGAPPHPGQRAERPALFATDIRQPDYFHKVVDCQWACPAHTPVPEYIRLIAAGRYADAYMVNWAVERLPRHPGAHLRPALRTRLPARPRRGERRPREPEPVAICRLKRVAADLKDDIAGRLPRAGAAKNGKRIACVGAGPAVADGRARPGAAGLRGHRVRQRCAAPAA